MTIGPPSTAPVARPPDASTALPAEVLLDVTGLQKLFPIPKGFLQRTVGHVRAVDGVDFHIDEGETLGLVGRERLRQDDDRALHRCAPSSRPRAGPLRVTGGAVVDLATAGRRELRRSAARCR